VGIDIRVADAEATAAGEMARHGALTSYRGVSWLDVVARAEELSRVGDRAEARAAYEAALWRIREAPDAATASELARWIARAWQVDSRHDEALDCIAAAEAIALAFGDRKSYGHALNVRAIIHWQRGDLDDAIRLYSQCLDIALEHADTQLAAMASQNLGVIATVRGEHEQALHHYKASLEGYRALGVHRDVYIVQNNLGRLYCDREQWEDAEGAFASALEVATALGASSHITMIEINVAEMWVKRRDLDQADEACRRAIARAAALHDSHADGEAYRVLGIIARERGDYGTAEQSFARGEEVAIAREDLLLQAHIERERAQLFSVQGRLHELVKSLTRARQLFGRLRAQRAMADVERLSRRVEQDFLRVVQSYGESIEENDHYTQGHCERVADLACTLAVRCGVDEASLFWFRVGAVLHDVGKIDIDPEILNKPDRLTPDEWLIVKQHPLAGVEVVRDIGLPEDVVQVVRSHHESWDGTGYPDGLRGERIPMWARIVCIADVYDALTSERSYKRAISHDEAMTVMRRDAGRQFDPALFQLFDELTSANPPSQRRAAPVEAGPSAGRITSAAGSAAPDDLTGLPLRKAFLAAVARALADAGGSQEAAASLLVIDVDHFKLVNDTYGHLQGDDVLRAVARTLQDHVRPGDLVGRYAGDEFVVLLPHTSHDAAMSIAERLRASVEAIKLIVRERRSDTLGVTLSIGVATSGAGVEQAEELFAAADSGLYVAKRRGRNGVGSATAASTDPAVPSLDFERFVGRVTELRTLIRGLEKAAAGQPQLINVVGEAGVGKSTLVRQLRPEARLRGAVMVAGRFIEADVKPPYGPWAEVLDAIHRQGLVPPRAWPELGRLVPALGRVDHPRVSPGSKYALLAELAEYLRLASSRNTLIVVLDDVQWGDSSSWDALEFVLQQLDQDRILFCLTTRVEDVGAIAERRRRLSRDERTRELQLQRLTLAELRLWIETVFHHGSIGDAFPQFLHGYTEGNPLLVVHVLRSLLEDGSIWYAGSRWQWNDAPELRLPSAVADLIAARVARLSEGARKHLSLAAVLGRNFDIDVVLEAGEFDEDAFLDSVDEGITAKVVENTGGAGDGHYSFSHGLIAAAMRTSLNKRRLARAHERVAQALESLRPAAVSDIAAHYDAAGNSAKAFEFALLAADRAVAVYAHDEAAASFAVAQRHAPSAAARLDTRIRQANALELGGRYADGAALCDLIIAEEVSSGGGEGLLPVRRLRERLRQMLGQPLVDTRRACELLLAEAERRADRTEEVLLLGMLSRIYLLIGEPVAGAAFARRAVSSAESMADPKLLADTLLHLGSTLLAVNAAESVGCYQRALETVEAQGDVIAQARCHINLGIAMSQAGESDASRDSYTRALELGRRTHTPDIVGLASLNLAVLHMKVGRYEEADGCLQDAMQQFQIVRNEPHRLAALYNLANLARERGDQHRAADLYGEAAVVAASAGQIDVEIGARSGQGLSQLAIGRRDEGGACLRTAEVLLSRHADWWFQGRELLAALRVRWALAAGNVREAERVFRGSLITAERHDLYGAAWLVAELAVTLADAGVPDIHELVERFRGELSRLDFAPLTARYARLQLGARVAP
jgi:diguanylate cyclase (GGDEF)-like protein/putative nucleotidyltransferase with HDIG domain